MERTKDMKKKYIIIITIILLGVISFFYYEKMHTETFLNLPKAKEVASIQIRNESENRQCNQEEINMLLQELSEYKLTNKKSVKDIPLTDKFSTIIITLRDSSSITLYKYQDDGDKMIEIPYQGIYQSGIQ